MQRLISDAAKMTDVQKELGVTVDESSMSFGNVVNAISVMQKSLGIAGTTAEEGTKTISGSINKLSASWQNFLTGIFDENADMGALGEQLFSSLGDVLMNVAPRIVTLIQRVVLGLPDAIIQAFDQFPTILAPAIISIFGDEVGHQITDSLYTAFDQFGEMMHGLYESVVGVLQQLWTTIQPLLAAIGELFMTVAPIIMDAVGFVVSFISEQVLPFVSEVAEAIRPVIEQIAASIQEHMPEIQAVIETVMGVIKDVINAVWPFVSTVVVGAVETIANIVKAVWPVISQVITVACNAIKGIVDAVYPVIKTVIVTVFSAIQSAAEVAWPIISGVVETAAGAISAAIDGISWLVDFVSGIFEGIQYAIEHPMEAACDFIGNIIDTIKGFFNFDIQWPHIPLPHFEAWGSPNPLDWLSGGAPGFAINWYAKGGFVDEATLIGAGEAGPEMILPRQGLLMDDFASRISERIDARGVDIHDCDFYVREESDIRRIAEELNTLINRQTAGAFA